MARNGFNGASGFNCEKKFKHMRTTYESIIYRLSRTGGGGESRWLYFDQMHELLKNDVAVNPDNIVEAGAAGFNRIRRHSVNFIYF